MFNVDTWSNSLEVMNKATVALAHQIRSACLIRLNNMNCKGLYTHSPRSFLRSIRSPSLPLSCRGSQKIDDGLLLAYVFTSLKVSEGGEKKKESMRKWSFSFPAVSRKLLELNLAKRT